MQDGGIANWVRSTSRIWPCTSSPRTDRRSIARPGHRSTRRIFVGRQDRSTTRRIRRRATDSCRNFPRTLLARAPTIGPTANSATPVRNNSSPFARRNDGSNARPATVVPCTTTTSIPMEETRFCHRASTRIWATGIADTPGITGTIKFSRIICKCIN